MFNKRGMVWDPKNDYWEIQYLQLKINSFKPNSKIGKPKNNGEKTKQNIQAL